MTAPLLLVALLGAACAAPPRPAPRPSPEATAVISERIDLALPHDAIVPVPALGGTVRLIAIHTSHDDAGRETSAGRLELVRGEAREVHDFDANRAFPAWGVTMVVFGASGSYQLSLFPPGVPVRP